MTLISDPTDVTLVETTRAVFTAKKTLPYEQQKQLDRLMTLAPNDLPLAIGLFLFQTDRRKGSYVF
jgi:hypothetical protein